MHGFSKTLRRYFWTISAIFTRYKKTILLSFTTGLVIFIAIYKFSPQLVKLLEKPRIIGIVGFYSPSKLPLSVQQKISIGLTTILPDGSAGPGLANSWTVSDDGKVYEFKLKNDLIWHDKRKFTASDVNYQLKDVEFSAPFDNTLKITLKEPFSPLPNFLSKPLFSKGLIGIGQYKVAVINLNDDNVSYLKLVPVNSEGQPIEYKFFTSESQAITAFKLGEINELEEVLDASQFSKWQNIRIQDRIRYDQFVGIFFNLNDEFLKNKDVRQALNFAIIKPEKNRISTPLSTTSWAYTNQIKQYEIDTEQAKKLLGSDKLASVSAKLTINVFPQYLNLAQSIASAWTGIGVPTQVKMLNGMTSDFQAILAVWEIPSDPDQYPLWHSTQTLSNISHYANPKIDKLLEDGRKERNQEKRKKIYYDFQKYLVEDSPAVFLFHPTTYSIMRK